MRRLILYIAISILAFVVVQAQTNSGSVTLSLKLYPIQTLVINSSQKSIDIVYSDASDYKNGVSSEQKDHLKIFSTGAFAVNVHAASDDIKRADGDESVSAQTLKVKAAPGTSNAMTSATFGEVSLSSTATNLITSEVGGIDRNFNITYSGQGADAYVNKYYDNESPTTYSTTVTYTIAAQ